MRFRNHKKGLGQTTTRNEKSQTWWHTLPGMITAVAGSITAIAVLVGTLIQTGSFKAPVNSNSNNRTTMGSAEPERTLSYWLLVQKCARRKPCEPPFRLPDATYIFEEDFRVRLNITTPQAGYTYVLNESLEKEDGSARYIILYPSTSDKQDTAATQTTVPGNDWFEFDNKKGTERLWVVWSETPIEEVEATRELANARNQGRIIDTEQTQAIDDLLDKYSALRSGVDKDETNKRTNIRARGDVIVYPISLEHR